MKSSFFLLIVLIFQTFFFSNCSKSPGGEIAAMQVLKRVAGQEVAAKFKLEYVKSDQPTDSYSIAVENDQVIIKGSSQVALCRGAYDYLRNYCNSIVSWSGNRIQLPETLPASFHAWINKPTPSADTSTAAASPAAPKTDQ